VGAKLAAPEKARQPKRERTKSEQFRALQLEPPKALSLPATADYHRIEKKFAKSGSGRTPVPIVQDTDRIATETYEDIIMGRMLPAGSGLPEMEKPFHEDLMKSLKSAIDQLILLLDQYNTASLTLKRRFRRRVKETWDELPKLATVAHKAAAKVAGIGIFGSLWGAVYLAINQYVSQPVALIITAGAAFAGFFAANRTTAKFAAPWLRAFDEWQFGARLSIVRWRYSRKKVKKLQALATVVRDEISRVHDQKPPQTKEGRKLMEAAIKEQNRTIKELCSTLPNPREPRNPDYEISG